jgi:cytochrome P450
LLIQILSTFFCEFTFLFSSNHEKWRTRRRLITPSFHDTQLLHNYMLIFNEQSSILVHRLDEYAKQPNKTHDLYPYISACTLDIIAGLLKSSLKNL